jgi:hypothetical protein
VCSLVSGAASINAGATAPNNAGAAAPIDAGATVPSNAGTTTTTTTSTTTVAFASQEEAQRFASSGFIESCNICNYQGMSNAGFDASIYCPQCS